MLRANVAVVVDSTPAALNGVVGAVQAGANAQTLVAWTRLMSDGGPDVDPALW